MRQQEAKKKMEIKVSKKLQEELSTRTHGAGRKSPPMSTRDNEGTTVVPEETRQAARTQADMIREARQRQKEEDERKAQEAQTRAEEEEEREGKAKEGEEEDKRTAEVDQLRADLDVMVREVTTLREEREELGREVAKGRNLNAPSVIQRTNRNVPESIDLGRLIKGQLIRSNDYRSELDALEAHGGPDWYGGGAVAGIPLEFLRMTDSARKSEDRIRASGLSGNQVPVSTITEYLAPSVFPVNMAPLLARFNTEYGARDTRKVLWAGTKPSRTNIAEGAAFTRTDPSVIGVDLSPRTVGSGYDITSAAMAADGGAFADFVEGAVAALLNEHVTGQILNGPGGSDAIQGVWNQNSGTGSVRPAEFTFGLAADTNNNKLDISVAISAEETIYSGKPTGMDLIWVVGNEFRIAAAAKPYGPNSDRFVYERDATNQGMVHNTPAFPFQDLTVNNRNAVALLLMADAVRVIVWGGGIEMIARPSTTSAVDEYAFRMHVNSIVVNPINAIRFNRAHA